MNENKTLSISDLMQELSCSRDRARTIMLMELPHMDISMPGSRMPSWRCKRKDYEKWAAAREERPENEKLRVFSRKYM